MAALGIKMAPDISAYISVMEEIKKRTAVVHSLLNQETNVIYRATHIESMVLQVRMITELIALANLAANKKLFELNKSKFEKHWHPDKILKDIKVLNQNFYPIPIKEVPPEEEGVKNQLVGLKNGFLTQAQLVTVHGRCGNLLHAKNPYGKGVDYEWYEEMVPQWMEKIMALLNCHQIKLLNDKVFYLVHMKEERDDKVHMYTFQRQDA